METLQILVRKHGYAYLFSKILGAGMTLGACFSKLPIILNILKAGNCDGLSPLALYLETSAFLASIVYNVNKGNPFSTYGDMGAITVQMVLLISFVWIIGMKDKKQVLSFSHMLAVSLFFAAFTYTILRLIPTELSSYLIFYSIVVSLFSKIPQIIRNYREKDTGVQSLITAINAIIGPVVKIYITIVETKDLFLFVYSLLVFLLNILIFWQILLYGKTKKD